MGYGTTCVRLNFQGVTFGQREFMRAPSLGLLDLLTLTLVILVTLFDLCSAALEFLQVGLLVALRTLHFLGGKIAHFGAATCRTQAQENQAVKNSGAHEESPCVYQKIKGY
jgi:hypothetical protein